MDIIYSKNKVNTHTHTLNNGQQNKIKLSLSSSSSSNQYDMCQSIYLLFHLFFIFTQEINSKQNENQNSGYNDYMIRSIINTKIDFKSSSIIPKFPF